jgi:hypothetical protein
MAFPQEHWRQLHSTNPLERLHKEIKRRTDVVGIFPNRAALLRPGERCPGGGPVGVGSPATLLQPGIDAEAQAASVGNRGTSVAGGRGLEGDGRGTSGGEFTPLDGTRPGPLARSLTKGPHQLPLRTAWEVVGQANCERMRRLQRPAHRYQSRP